MVSYVVPLGGLSFGPIPLNEQGGHHEHRSPQHPRQRSQEIDQSLVPKGVGLRTTIPNANCFQYSNVCEEHDELLIRKVETLFGTWGSSNFTNVMRQPCPNPFPRGVGTK